MSNTFLILFLNKILNFRQEFAKCLSELQTEKTLIRLLLRKQSDWGLHCFLGLFSTQLVFEILEHLPYSTLSYDVASWSERMPCHKIDKPLMVYRFTGPVMTSITTLLT